MCQFNYATTFTRFTQSMASISSDMVNFIGATRYISFGIFLKDTDSIDRVVLHYDMEVMSFLIMYYYYSTEISSAMRPNY